MKLFTTVFALFITFNFTAQPILNEWYNYQVGDEFNYQIVTNPPMNLSTITATGTNVIWDFSNLLLEDTLRLNKILPYALSNAPNAFPGCDFVLEEYTGTQQFYKRSGDTVYYMGNVHLGSTSTYAPYAPLFANPMIYNGQVSNNLMTVTAPGYSGYWYTKMDYKAYGTLKLPNGVEYPNVGLMYGDLGTIDNGYKSLSFNWVIPGEKTPLMRIQYKQLGGGTPTLELAYIRSDFENLNTEENKWDLNAIAYPNPFKERVHIQLQEVFTGNISLVNTLGQLILKEKHTGVNEVNIPTVNLQTGVYILQIESGDKKRQLKLIKE
jgi:hypothetical protein